MDNKELTWKEKLQKKLDTTEEALFELSHKLIERYEEEHREEIEKKDAELLKLKEVLKTIADYDGVSVEWLCKLARETKEG